VDLQPHHVGFVVSDLARSLRFYEALGFEVESSMEPEPGRSLTFIRLGDFSLELFWYEVTPPAPTASAATGGPQLGFRHFALKTSDIDAVVVELKAKGLLGDDAQIREVMGRYRLLFMHDPDGVEIELTQEL
jgi:catechol 2,3-dioxygenase-like lactoylglutathione lyase family enzyme